MPKTRAEPLTVGGQGAPGWEPFRRVGSLRVAEPLDPLRRQAAAPSPEGEESEEGEELK